MFLNTQGGGNSFAFPDVCKTPTPTGPVPIPYPNTAMGTMANPGTAASKVLAGGQPAHSLKTKIPQTNGDNAGVATGVVSNVVMNQSQWTMGSTKVQVENQPAVRLTSPTGQNGSNPNAVGATIAPSQTTVMIMS